MLSNCTVKARFTDTHLIRTPYCYWNFTFSPGKESAHISSKFNPFNTVTFYDSVSVRINGIDYRIAIAIKFDNFSRAIYGRWIYQKNVLHVQSFRFAY